MEWWTATGWKREPIHGYLNERKMMPCDHHWYRSPRGYEIRKRLSWDINRDKIWRQDIPPWFQIHLKKTVRVYWHVNRLPPVGNHYRVPSVRRIHKSNNAGLVMLRCSCAHRQQADSEQSNPCGESRFDFFHFVPSVCLFTTPTRVGKSCRLTSRYRLSEVIHELPGSLWKARAAGRE
jgi:hypothetical protein